MKELSPPDSNHPKKQEGEHSHKSQFPFQKKVSGRPSKIFFGWWVVLAAFIVHSIPSSFYSSVTSIFFLPLTKDLRLSRTSTSLVFSLSRAQGALSGPIVGYAVDRWGPGQMVFLGTLITTGGYLLLARVDSYTGLILIYIGVISVGHNIGFMHTVLTAVNQWFVKKRGMAMGLVGSAVGFGGAFTAPTLGMAVHLWGWRVAAILAGIAALVTAVPCSFLLRKTPDKMGLHPDGTSPPELNKTTVEQSGIQNNEPTNFTFTQAFRTKSFWMLLLAITLRLAVNHTITIHFIPIMVWKGVTATYGSFLLGAIGVLNIPLRILLGVLGDIWPKARVMTFALVLGSLTLVYLVYSEGTWQLWLFILLYTIPDATGTLNWAMIGDFYGRRSFATIRGSMNLVYGWGTAVFPVLAGIIYDRTESYSIILWFLSLVWAASAIVFMLVRPPKSPPLIS